MTDTNELKRFIALFLRINPDPSDDEFHALAHAASIDKETLESIAYEMLGRELENDHAFAMAATRFTKYAAFTEDTEALSVLDGDYDPDSTGVNNLLLNDGAPAGSSGQQGIQDALLNDGLPTSDSVMDKSLQNDTLADGVVPFHVASSRRARKRA